MTRVLVPYMLSFPGGVHRVLCDGLPELARMGRVRVDYAELAGNEEDMGRMERLGVPVLRGIGPRASGILSARRGVARVGDRLVVIPRLLRIIRQLSTAARRYDVLYVHGYRELVFAALAIALLGRRRPALVWHCHGLGDGRPPPMTVRFANTCARVIGVSDDVVGRLQELGVSSRKLRRVYNAVLLDRGPEDPAKAAGLPSRHGQTILVASASLRPAKGAHLVVQALAKLPSSVNLWLTGDTKEDVGRDTAAALVRCAESLGVAGRLHLLGRRADIVNVIQHADVVVVPSLCREGFGLVAAEAMLLCKPVIVSNRGGLPEVVGSPECGWTFDPDVPGDLDRCLVDVLGNRQRAQQVARLAFERATTRFAYERWAREVSVVLEEAAATRIGGHF